MKKTWLFLIGTIFIVACGPVSEQSPATQISFETNGCDYSLPFSGLLGEVEVSQGNGGLISHQANSSQHYAFDFDMDEGQYVLAARDGDVVAIHDGETACGGEDFIPYSNYVKIKHDDGTVAVYMHLEAGIHVEEGDRVESNDIIGYAGNTGYTNCEATAGRGYHLHFQVQDSEHGRSIPACFIDVEGDGLPGGSELVSANNQVALVQVGTIIAAPGDEQPSISSEIEIGVALDRRDAYNVVLWLATKLAAGDYAVQEAIDSLGASFVPSGVGFNTIGRNNGAEFAVELALAAGSTPAKCEGFRLSDSSDPLPKLEIVFSGLRLDEDVTGIEHETDLVSFLFIAEGNFWELVVVSPQPSFAADYVVSGLRPCS